MEEQNKKFMSHETLLNKYSEERLALNKLTLISDGLRAYGHSDIRMDGQRDLWRSPKKKNKTQH